MNLEEEHKQMHRRGEMIKFLVLVLVLVGTVLLIALLRPIVFEGIVPAILGWNETSTPLQAPETTTPEATATDDESMGPVIMTATPPVGADSADGTTADGSGSAPLPTPRTYEVQQGDTLVEISQQIGVSVQALVEANAITNPNRIQPGDVLVIPPPQ